MERIIIFSRSIRSGKTTELQEWIKGRKNIAGILTPDQGDLRMLEHIRSGKRYPLQTLTETKGCTSIGRFHFLNSGFKKAREILLEELEKENDWLIVDEVGKLEMERDCGLEPAVTKVMEHYQHRGEGRLLVVVRDFLLNDFLTHYTVFRCKVVTRLEDI